MCFVIFSPNSTAKNSHKIHFHFTKYMQIWLSGALIAPHKKGTAFCDSFSVNDNVNFIFSQNYLNFSASSVSWALFSSVTAPLIVTVPASSMSLLSMKSFVIYFAAIGAHEPFSINAIFLF